MAAGEPLGFACACGRLRGEVVDAYPAAYTHVACHCDDCRSAYTHLGQADPRKVGILQTTQDRIRITAGEDHLQVFRLSPRGALRWFASCCNTPLFFTPLKARLVHAGLNIDRLDAPETVGPIVAEGFVPGKNGKQTHKNLGRMLARMASRIIARNISGDWRDTPFFTKDGTPKVPPRTLSREERDAAKKALTRL